MFEDKKLQVGSFTLNSRLIVGTGKYQSLEQTAQAISASGAHMVTMAVRRMNLGQDRNAPNLLDFLPKSKYLWLPNTAGCYDADSAVRTCALARELLDDHRLVKLEVLGDEKTLYPNITETLKALKTLVAMDFEVMVYTNDDPIVAKKLEDLGAIAVMPLASLIGSGLGLINRHTLSLMIEQAQVPLIVDAGVGTASDVVIAMEMGCEGVLLNSAMALAQYPVMMAQAMQSAIVSGRHAFLAGRMPKRELANPSSPVEGLIH